MKCFGVHGQCKLCGQFHFLCTYVPDSQRTAERIEQDEFVANKAALAALQVSHREYEVLQLLAEGFSNKEIAEQLFVSPNTIKTHIARLYEKLDVSRRTQAVHKAKSLQLIA